MKVAQVLAGLASTCLFIHHHLLPLLLRAWGAASGRAAGALKEPFGLLVRLALALVPSFLLCPFATHTWHAHYAGVARAVNQPAASQPASQPTDRTRGQTTSHTSPTQGKTGLGSDGGRPWLRDATATFHAPDAFRLHTRSCTDTSSFGLPL